MKKTLSALAVFALGASLAFAAPQSQDGKTERGYGRHHGAFGEKMAAKLNLSDAQKQQIRDLQDKFRTDNAAFLQSFRQTREDLRAAKQANDTAKLDALRPTFESQKAQMKQLREVQREKIRTILTPEQRAQFDTWKAQHEKSEQK